MDIGVFIPIGDNGWLISRNSPQYMPTFELVAWLTDQAAADTRSGGDTNVRQLADPTSAGTAAFGVHIQPLMHSRRHVSKEVA